MKKARDEGTESAEVERLFRVYKRLLDDRSISLEQDKEGFISWDVAVRSKLSQVEFDTYRSNATEWNLRINNYHKRLFRDNALTRLFGYTLGTTFAQQYGLSSEGLDATKSLGVACFFAAHDSSDFLKVVDEGVGVIYRLPFPPKDVAMRPLDTFDYYNMPSVIDVEDVFYRFENNLLSKEDSIACMLCYLEAALARGLQSGEMMLVPEGFLRTSRVLAQEAVIMIPDEVREDEPGRQPSHDGRRLPKYRYIEDVRSRPGVTRFYFKHTGLWPEKLKAINRERLWPRDDLLLETLVLLIASSYRLGQVIPKRLDLIDGGYAQDEFLAVCKELYGRYRHRFGTGYEGVASSFGALSF